jgi:transposase
MAAIEITRKDLTARELRAASAKERDAKAARRMLAIALVLEGKDRKTAAETCGMDRQTLRDWVQRELQRGPKWVYGSSASARTEQKTNLQSLEGRCQHHSLPARLRICIWR